MAGLMRRILVDLARSRRNQKRGGNWQRVTLDGALLPSATTDLDLVAVDEALEDMARIDVRKAKVVELRFFAGLTVEETAEVLQISGDTVARDWTFAKAWLSRELRINRG
jgi:RNA polymerase sigma factor (TIGR02999 family)